MLLSRVILSLILISLASGLSAETLNGRVVGISDGDTLTLLTSGKQRIKIRLAEIDTLESGQPYGKKAKQALSTLAFNKQANISVQDVDRYGRTIGRVYVDGVDVNAELVRNGSAWVYRKYVKDKLLFSLERQARENKKGLWNLPESEQVPPWEWRQGIRNSLISTDTVLPDSCGNKTRCSQMNSCSEAKFYLNQCAATRLDGDRDGVPCEAIC